MKHKECEELIKKLENKIEEKCEYLDDYTDSICRDAARIVEIKKEIAGMYYTINKIKEDLALLVEDDADES